MVHRGPDDHGLWLAPDARVAMGHRRLSILDLSPLGRQPMFSRCGNYGIAYNGEVYNFREIRRELQTLGHSFRSESDTEVVLLSYMQWGERCVGKFVGMFSFVIWDSRKDGFFAARDRLGVKPLYYHAAGERFMAASRLRPLLDIPECPRKVDPEAVRLYLEAGYVPAPWSILKGVRKLRPGHTLWADRSGVEEKCYWDAGKIAIDYSLADTPEDELADRLDCLLKESIQLRLISDVPLGAFLSGGIDSSLVVALMRDVSGRPPRTFTIGFHEKEFDESAPARAVARSLKTEHHEQELRARDLLPLLEHHSDHYDEPFADWSSVATMAVSKFARQHVTVALSGDGGDELFAGYSYYSHLKKLVPLMCTPRGLRKAGGILLRQLGKHRTQLLAAALGSKDPDDAFVFMRSMTKDYGNDLLCERGGLSLSELFRQRASGFAPLDPISRAARLDACYYLADDILQKLDVASMSVGLEAREPLLDHRLVEFAFSLPLQWKLHHGKGKRLLRRVLARYLPVSLFDRPKRGFEVPIRDWFRGDLKDPLRDELSPKRIQKLPFIRAESVDHLIQLHLAGKRDTHPVLWALLSFQRWYERILGAGAVQ